MASGMEKESAVRQWHLSLGQAWEWTSTASAASASSALAPAIRPVTLSPQFCYLAGGGGSKERRPEGDGGVAVLPRHDPGGCGESSAQGARGGAAHRRHPGGGAGPADPCLGRCAAGRACSAHAGCGVPGCSTSASYPGARSGGHADVPGNLPLQVCIHGAAQCG
jgi:hypothetical protein